MFSQEIESLFFNIYAKNRGLTYLSCGSSVILYHESIIKEVGKYEDWSGKRSSKVAVKVISLQRRPGLTPGDGEKMRDTRCFWDVSAINMLWLCMGTWKFYSVLGITLQQGDRQGGAHVGRHDEEGKRLGNVSYGLSWREGKCNETDHCFQPFEELSCGREIKLGLVWPSELQHLADSFQL